jgi:hypothetical protein
MTALESETEDNNRLRKAAEAVEHFKQAEAEALRALASVRSSLTTARRREAELFAECEKRACERRKSGQIENVVSY